MTDSILNSIKKLLGLDAEYDVFDTDIIIHINTILSTLVQIGVGSYEHSTVTGPDETWADFLGADTRNVELVKLYVYMRVRLIFDPPSSSAVIEAYNKAIAEFEWRANVAVETPVLEGTSPFEDETP